MSGVIYSDDESDLSVVSDIDEGVIASGLRQIHFNLVLFSFSVQSSSMYVVVPMSTQSPKIYQSLGHGCVREKCN